MQKLKRSISGPMLLSHHSSENDNSSRYVAKNNQSLRIDITESSSDLLSSRYHSSFRALSGCSVDREKEDSFHNQSLSLIDSSLMRSESFFSARTHIELENVIAGNKLRTLHKLKGLLARGATHELMQEGKKTPTDMARVQLDFLQKSIAPLLQLSREESEKFDQFIDNQLEQCSLKLPSIIKGTIEKNKNGEIYSKNPAIDALLKYVRAKYPFEFDNLNLPKDLEVSMPLEKEILKNINHFEKGCHLQGIDIACDMPSIKKDINLSSYITRQIIKKSNTSLGENANLLSDRGKDQSSIGSMGKLSPTLSSVIEPSQHPFAFLQKIRYSVQTPHTELKNLIEQACNDMHPESLELRARLGAHAVNTVLNHKGFDWKLAIAMLISVSGSGAIAYALDMQATEKFLRSLAKKWGRENVRTRFVAAFAESLVPSPAEFFDSLVVKRIIEKMRGNAMFPSSLADLKDDLKEASIAGLISAAGSLPVNFIDVCKKLSVIPASALGSMFATATAAAMAPMQVASAREEMIAAVIQQRNSGFFKTPDVPVFDNGDLHALAKALERDAAKDVESALETTPGINQTINSMGIGQMISFFAGFAPFTALTHTGKLPEMAKKIAAIAINQPTEVLSLATGILTGNYVGHLPGLLSTDNEKNDKIAALILDSARQRVENAQKGMMDTTVEITEKQLQRIEHPALELTFPLGRTITNTMNAVADLLSSSVAKLRGKDAHPSLASMAARLAAQNAVVGDENV